VLAGQAAALVRCVAVCLAHILQPSQQQQQQQGSSSSSSAGSSELLLLLPLLCEPLAAVLDALPVDLTTATSVAAAVQQLLGGGSSRSGSSTAAKALLWQPLAATAAAAGNGVSGSSKLSGAAEVQLLLRLLASCNRCVCVCQEQLGHLCLSVHCHAAACLRLADLLHV
jgi:hypothetical protein